MSRRTHPPDALTVLAELNVQLSKGNIGIYDHGQAVKALLELQQAGVCEKPEPKTVITYTERDGLRIESTHPRRIALLPWILAWVMFIALVSMLILR